MQLFQKRRAQSALASLVGDSLSSAQGAEVMLCLIAPTHPATSNCPISLGPTSISLHRLPGILSLSTSNGLTCARTNQEESYEHLLNSAYDMTHFIHDSNNLKSVYFNLNFRAQSALASGRKKSLTSRAMLYRFVTAFSFPFLKYVVMSSLCSTK